MDVRREVGGNDGGGVGGGGGKPNGIVVGDVPVPFFVSCDDASLFNISELGGALTL